jgi:hypothetical protein
VWLSSSLQNPVLIEQQSPSFEGEPLGDNDSMTLFGCFEGAIDGDNEGSIEGRAMEKSLGTNDGELLGPFEGSPVDDTLGEKDGMALGLADGYIVGV